MPVFVPGSGGVGWPRGRERGFGMWSLLGRGRVFRGVRGRVVGFGVWVVDARRCWMGRWQRRRWVR